MVVTVVVVAAVVVVHRSPLDIVGDVLLVPGAKPTWPPLVLLQTFLLFQNHSSLDYISCLLKRTLGPIQREEEVSREKKKKKKRNDLDDSESGVAGADGGDDGDESDQRSTKLLHPASFQSVC